MLLTRWIVEAFEYTGSFASNKLFIRNIVEPIILWKNFNILPLLRGFSSIFAKYCWIWNQGWAVELLF